MCAFSYTKKCSNILQIPTGCPTIYCDSVHLIPQGSRSLSLVVLPTLKIPIGSPRLSPKFLLCCSVTKLRPILCDPVDCSMPGFPVLWYLLDFAQTHVHWVGDAIQPSHPRVPFSCPSSSPSSGPFPMSPFFSSGQSIDASPCLSYEYWGLIYFRIDSFELLAVQGTLKSLLKHWSSKASFLQCLFVMVQLTSIIATGKTIALTIRTFEVVAAQVAASSSCARCLVTFGTRRVRVLAPFPSVRVFSKPLLARPRGRLHENHWRVEPHVAGCTVPLGQTMAKKLLLRAAALRVLCFPSPPSLPCCLPAHEHPLHWLPSLLRQLHGRQNRDSQVFCCLLLENILKRWVFVGKEKLIYSGCQQPGRRLSSVEKPTPKILLDHECFQRETHLRRRDTCLPYLPLCRLSSDWSVVR